MASIDPAPWVQALDSSATRVVAAGDADAVHDLRVATRRLSVWLRLAGIKALRDDLRWIRRAAGRVRDLDVATLDDRGFQRWRRSRRGARYRELVANLTSSRFAALIAALGTLPPLDRSAADRQLAKLATKTLGLAGDTVPDDIESFHALRRAVRQVRYGLEWRGDTPSAFRAFQDLAGAAADDGLLLRLLAEDPKASDRAGQVKKLERSFERKRRKTAEAWPSVRRKLQALT